jgi:hypothetical protein
MSVLVLVAGRGEPAARARILAKSSQPRYLHLLALNLRQRGTRPRAQDGPSGIAERDAVPVRGTHRTGLVVCAAVSLAGDRVPATITSGDRVPATSGTARPGDGRSARECVYKFHAAGRNFFLAPAAVVNG